MSGLPSKTWPCYGCGEHIAYHAQNVCAGCGEIVCPDCCEELGHYKGGSHYSKIEKVLRSPPQALKEKR